MAGGRPPKYKPEYCEMLVEHMGKGLSYESFAALIDTCRATLYVWEKQYPEFLDSKKRGFEKMSMFFEKMGISAMAGKIKNFNAATYIFTLKNKLKWTDKTEIEQTNTNISINIDESDDEL